jgi:hypothetical protein
MKQCLLQVLSLLVCAMLCTCSASQKSGPPARLTLLISGNTTGYLRNCGCQSGQYGGELRRARLLKQERVEALKPRPADKGRSSAVLTIDQGSTLDGDEYIERLYSRQILKSMARTEYDLLGLGEKDLVFGQEDLFTYLREIETEQGQAELPFLPLTAVNLHFAKPVAGPDHSSELNKMIQKYRVVDLGNGFKVGLIHAIDQGVTMDTREDGKPVSEYFGFAVSDPAKATEAILKQHGKEADFWIFTLADGIEGSTDPASIAKLQGLDLVIGFTGSNPNQAGDAGDVVKPFFMKGPILKARDLVKIVVSFGERDHDEFTITGQQLSVGANIKGDEYVLGLIDEIYPEIEIYEKELLKTEKLTPNYVGQNTCATCHSNIYQAMLASKHQHSFESLELRAKEDPEQSNAFKDPNCLRCHVTAYNSQHGGWNKLHPEPELQMISCEVCHGPGQYHVQLKMPNNPIEPPEDLLADGRNEHGLLEATKQTCLQCHDAENSPKFDFDEYWGRIRHSLDMPVPQQNPGSDETVPGH